MRTTSLFSLCCIALLACGDDKDSKRPDARVIVDDDAAVDAPAVTCQYTEMADATNDDLFGAGTPEATGASFTGTTLAICGVLNNGHFNSTETAVDVDSYRLTVPAASQGLIYLTAPGAENLQSVAIEISGITTSTSVSEVGVMVGDFAAVAAELPTGDYLITVSAYNATDATAPIDYKISMVVDSTTRCPESTAAAAFTEAGDTVTASGNDVYEVRYGGGTTVTTTVAGVDAPETTGIIVAPNTTHRISGVSSDPAADPVSWMDAYQDRDTYQITMGATTNTLAVRLNWASTTGDLDFFVFPNGSTEQIAVGWDNANMEDEFTTFAVTPGATYSLWVALDDPSTGQPINYDVTLCGTSFVTSVRSNHSAATDRVRRHPVFSRTVRPLFTK